ncbi:hypothetical protein DMENIID0001_027940 [Sergentomyia squamirostris]
MIIKPTILRTAYPDVYFERDFEKSEFAVRCKECIKANIDGGKYNARNRKNMAGHLSTMHGLKEYEWTDAVQEAAPAPKRTGRLPRRKTKRVKKLKLDSSDEDEYENRFVESAKDLSSEEEEEEEEDVWKSNFTPTDESEPEGDLVATSARKAGEGHFTSVGWVAEITFLLIEMFSLDVISIRS